MKWNNFGDVNYVEYGGCLVRPHWAPHELIDYPSLASQYDVFWSCPSEETEGVYFAALCMVDLEDYEYDAIFQKDHDNEAFAARIVEQYGAISLGGRAYKAEYPFTLSEAELSYSELCRWLQQLEGDEFIPKEYIQNIAYERYKCDWIGNHLTMRMISSTVEDFNEFLKECHRLGESRTHYSFADYVEDYGFRGGTIWVCFDEFCGAEYQDEQYMEEILNSEDFRTYKVLRND